MTTKLVCDKCGRDIGRAITGGFHVVTIDEEPRDEDFCGASCLAKWLADEYPESKRPDFAGTRALLEQQAQLDELAMAGAYDNTEDVEAALPYSPPETPTPYLNGSRRNHSLAAAEASHLLGQRR